MNISEFKYYRPKTIKEACELKEKLRDSSFLSGGTFLIPLARKSNNIAKNIISLRSIQELSQITLKRKTLTLGAMVTLDDLFSDILIKEKIPLLAEVISYVSSSQIRNMATIAGNLCCGLPWVDLPIALLVLDAQIELASSKSNTTINITDFLQAPKLVIRNKLLRNIKIKIPDDGQIRYGFARIPKDTEADIALVSTCVAIRDLGNNKHEVIFAVNFGNRFSQRLLNVEKFSKQRGSGISWDKELQNKIREEIDSLESNEYRKDIIITCFKRAVEKLK